MIPAFVRQSPVATAVVVAAVILVMNAYIRRRPLAESTAELTGAVAGAASDVAGGIVQGIAAVVGVPTTSQSACCQAIAGYAAAGSAWERVKASFDVSARCPAHDYLRWASGGGSPTHCAGTGTAVQPAAKPRFGASGTW